MVLLKYLSNFWSTFEMSVWSFDINEDRAVHAKYYSTSRNKRL